MWILGIKGLRNEKGKGFYLCSNPVCKKILKCDETSESCRAVVYFDSVYHAVF